MQSRTQQLELDNGNVGFLRSFFDDSETGFPELVENSFQIRAVDGDTNQSGPAPSWASITESTRTESGGGFGTRQFLDLEFEFDTTSASEMVIYEFEFQVENAAATRTYSFFYLNGIADSQSILNPVFHFSPGRQAAEEGYKDGDPVPILRDYANDVDLDVSSQNLEYNASRVRFNRNDGNDINFQLTGYRWFPSSALDPFAGWKGNRGSTVSIADSNDNILYRNDNNNGGGGHEIRFPHGGPTNSSNTFSSIRFSINDRLNQYRYFVDNNQGISEIYEGENKISNGANFGIVSQGVGSTDIENIGEPLDDDIYLKSTTGASRNIQEWAHFHSVPSNDQLDKMLKTYMMSFYNVFGYDFHNNV